MNNNFCSNCGTPIGTNDNFCPNCGIAVKKIEPQETVNSKNKRQAKKSFSTKKVRVKNPSASNVDNPRKVLPVVKILYVVLVLLIVAFVISYMGGVFDSPLVSGSSSSGSFNDVHNGASLEQIQQINALEQTVQANPEDMQSTLKLANLLNDSGFKDKAIDYYKKYLVSNPKDADVLVDIGSCYYSLGKYDNAEKEMKEALKYQPNHQIANLNLGIVLLAKGKNADAIDWWKKAVKINPSNEIGKKAQELINSQ